ncbi:MAG: AtpZ/AtpI family protein [Saprospirales bacterium]|nr:MAG: AtpZ/AtpI family protein [Saprospirales bacterium]
MTDENKKRFDTSKLAPAAKYVGIGFELFATVLVGAIIGQWLDGKIAWETPIFTALLIPLFVIAYIYRLYRQLTKEK